MGLGRSSSSATAAAAAAVGGGAAGWSGGSVSLSLERDLFNSRSNSSAQQEKRKKERLLSGAMQKRGDINAPRAGERGAAPGAELPARLTFVDGQLRGVDTLNKADGALHVCEIVAALALQLQGCTKSGQKRHA